jgi:hypothetical protein
MLTSNVPKEKALNTITEISSWLVLYTSLWNMFIGNRLPQEQKIKNAPPAFCRGSVNISRSFSFLRSPNKRLNGTN